MDGLFFLEVTLAGLGSGGLYALAALAFVIVYKATRVVNIAIGEFLMMGAYVFYAFAAGMAWPVWAAIAGAVAVAFEQRDVAAGAEGLAGAAQQHDPDVGARLEPLGGALQVARHGDVDGVERGGLVQRQRGDAVGGFQQEGWKDGQRWVHGLSPLSGKYQLSIQKPRCYGRNQALARLPSATQA